MILSIKHTTSYCYEGPLTYAQQQVRLTPSHSLLQKIVKWEVEVEGGSIELIYPDQFDNQTMLIQTKAGQNEISITAHGEVETIDRLGIMDEKNERIPQGYFSKITPRTHAGRGIRSIAKKIDGTVNLLAGLHSLSNMILEAVPYCLAKTTARTTAEEAFNAGVGVCQDHAQIFIAAARQLGIPARYVSGYLLRNDIVSQEASHAWAEAYVDGLGWVGFDVSNGVSPDERYVRLAIGLDSYDAAPIRGVRMGGTNESMLVSLQIQQ